MDYPSPIPAEYGYAYEIEQYDDRFVFFFVARPVVDEVNSDLK